jgi:hypothetical protein
MLIAAVLASPIQAAAAAIPTVPSIPAGGFQLRKVGRPDSELEVSGNYYIYYDTVRGGFVAIVLSSHVSAQDAWVMGNKFCYLESSPVVLRAFFYDPTTNQWAGGTSYQANTGTSNGASYGWAPMYQFGDFTKFIGGYEETVAAASSFNVREGSALGDFFFTARAPLPTLEIPGAALRPIVEMIIKAAMITLASAVSLTALRRALQWVFSLLRRA